MADEKKTEKIEKAEQKARGDRGEVGVATAGKTLKARYRAEHFKRTDKSKWKRNPGAPSLKQFARGLAASGDKVAKDWFAHKAGSLNTNRSEKNVGRISLEKQASKAARRKKSQGKQGKAATDTAATATATVAGKKGK